MSAEAVIEVGHSGDACAASTVATGDGWSASNVDRNVSKDRNMRKMMYPANSTPNPAAGELKHFVDTCVAAFATIATSVAAKERALFHVAYAA